MPGETSYLDAIEQTFNESFPQGVPDKPGSAPPTSGNPADTEKPSAQNPPAGEGKGSPAPIAAILKQRDASGTPAEPTDDQREKEVAELTQGLSEKAADKFRAIHKRAYDAEQKAKRVADLEKQIQQLKEAGPTDDVKALKEQLNQYDSIIRKTALTKHPSWSKQYEEPIENAIKAAKMVVGSDLSEEVETLLRMPDNAVKQQRLETLFDDLSAFKANRLAQLVATIDEKNFEKQEALNAWQETEKQYRTQEQQRENYLFRHTQEQLATAAEDIIRRVSDPHQGVEAFMEVEGQPEWNQAVATRRSEIKKLIRPDLSPHDLAELVMQSVAARTYRDLLIESHKENEKLSSQLNKIKATGPDYTQTTPSKGGDIRDVESFVDAVDRMAKESGLIQ